MATKVSIESLMEVFYKTPTKEFTLRGLAKEAGLSHTAVIKFVNALEKRNFVEIETFGRAKKVSFNMESEEAVREKRIRNIKAAEVIKEEILKSGIDARAIILFGSFSRGEDIESSDIDIAVVGRKNFKVDFSKIEKKLNRRVNIIFFDIFRKIPENLGGSIINGVKLYGVIDV